MVCSEFLKLRNSIRNGMWPTSMSNLGSTVAVFLVLLTIEPQLTFSLNKVLWRVGDLLCLPKGLPRSLQALAIACVEGFIFVIVLMIIRQYLLRILLAYRGWMYEPLRGQQRSTLMWCMAVKLVSGYQPSLYSCQRSLPRLPVPSLKDTISKLFESLQPLCSQEEFAELKMQAKEFENTIGPKLQKILIFKSWISQNYVSDWWEKYVYLRGRVPLAINSNYYCFDQSYYTPTHLPVSRAATIIHNCLTFKRLIDREELAPLMLRGTVPICMAQYERLFSTVRIPGEDMDEVIHFESKESKHIVVLCKGLYYKMDVYDSRNQILCPDTFETELQWIVDDATKHIDSVSEESKNISALTALGRTEWAGIRKQFLGQGLNKESRDVVEKSILLLNLSDACPETLVERSKYMLHGDGKSIWFDKSLCLLVFGNAKAGMNCEHTMADAPAMGHMWEFAMTREVLEKQYDEDGMCMPLSKSHRQKTVKGPQRLVWEVEEPLANKIKDALQFAHKCNEDVDLIVKDHCDWGKGVIKKCKVSPDAFIQMALQVAYYKEARKVVQTYEASMTRMYLCGRTETVRSCTTEVVEFVKAMVTNHVNKEEKIRLLKRAADKHQKLYRDAMNGKGLDRHLFALFVACKGLQHESKFLSNIISRPWTLSTSQSPHNQLTNTPNSNMKVFNNKLSPGGGFGPVSDDGYGVAYIFPNDKKIFFHVSCKKSCPSTDSTKFLERLFESMDEMRALFE